MTAQRALYIALFVYALFVAMIASVLIAWKMQTFPSGNVRFPPPNDSTLEKTGSGGTAEQIANTTGASSSSKKGGFMK